MKLRTIHCNPTPKGGLRGIIAALSDEGDWLGFEDRVNLFSHRQRESFTKHCAQATGESEEAVGKLLAQLVKRLCTRPLPDIEVGLHGWRMVPPLRARRIPDIEVGLDG